MQVGHSLPTCFACIPLTPLSISSIRPFFYQHAQGQTFFHHSAFQPEKCLINQPTNQIAEKTTKFVYNTVPSSPYAAGTNHICRYGEWSFRYCITRLGPPLTTSGGSADSGQFSMLIMARFWQRANSYGSLTSEALSLM